MRFVNDRDKVLDLGCGNGRWFGLLREKDIDYVGMDNSEKLIEIAKDNEQRTMNSEQSFIKDVRFVVGDALDLPFKNNSFDKVFTIAVFHHIASKEFRLRFLKEAKRVLKPNGLLILTVWNLNQQRFWKYHLKYLFLKLIGKSKLDFYDIFYPWKNNQGEILAKRYIHCFTKRELKTLVKKTGFEIKKLGFLGPIKKNLYLVAEKSLF